MNRHFFWAFCLGIAASAGSACERSFFPGEDQLLENDGKFDQALISRLILEEVNVNRCAEGLADLKDDLRLAAVSFDHSAWMAAAAILSHDSHVKGRATLLEKLVASTFPYRTGAENIAYIGFYDFGGSSFFLENGECAFRNAQTNQIVKRHSYASAAASLVRNWMESPGHRKNIMLEDIDHAGAGVALDGSAAHCGRLYATHIFAGKG